MVKFIIFYYNNFLLNLISVIKFVRNSPIWKYAVDFFVWISFVLIRLLRYHNRRSLFLLNFVWIRIKLLFESITLLWIYSIFFAFWFQFFERKGWIFEWMVWITNPVFNMFIIWNPLIICLEIICSSYTKVILRRWFFYLYLIYCVNFFRSKKNFKFFWNLICA